MELPQFAPRSARFVDIDASQDSIAGHVDIDLGSMPATLGVTSIQLYLAGAGRVDPELRVEMDAPPSSTHLRVWLPRTNTSKFRSVQLLAYATNMRGRSETNFPIKVRDLVVSPVHPKARHWLEINMAGLSGTPVLSRASIASSVPGGQAFWVPQHGLYTVCMCPAQRECESNFADAEPIGQVMVLLIIGSPAQLVTPLVGNPFSIELHGSNLLGRRIRLYDNACQERFAEQDVEKTQLCRGQDGLVGSTGDRNTSQRWHLLVNTPRSMNLSWSEHSNETSESDCRDQQSIWRQPLHSFAIEPCLMPCQTCWVHPYFCTSCTDPSEFASHGSCWPRPTGHGSGDAQVMGSLVQTAYHGLAKKGMSLQTFDPSPLDALLNMSHEAPMVHRRECKSNLKRVHCQDRGPNGTKLENMGLVAPEAIAALGSSELLIVDPWFEVPDVGPTLTGAVFRLDLASGNIKFAVQPAAQMTCMSHPQSFRVAPGGSFWLIADMGNAMIRRVDASSKLMTTLAGNTDGYEVESCASSLPPRRFSNVLPLPPTRATLCRPSDVAIKLDETQILIAEHGGCIEGTTWSESPPRIRLLDDHDCDSFVVACGRVHMFLREGSKWTKKAFHQRLT
eukprot:CAMPEP_0115198534 /NCGR_PEP_ID=MMETSP0270-20121206/16156_1 /TAXON_ID=71861 /ORGANISM="Scrippsiella trochoidea, Strain CCMP3099" /LENGTH=618 /DNA_ID=CAMNT_0002611911 /DNA_START=302 /DNA_END=2156 /DNA_ORIENTATION=+